MNPDIEQLERLYNILLSQKDYPDNYYSAEFEYFRLINKSDFLTDCLREIVKNDVLKKSTLYNTSDYLFLVSAFYTKSIPKFLTHEIEEKHKLSAHFLQQLAEAQKESKNEKKLGRIKYRPNWTKQGSHEDLLKVQELHIAILENASRMRNKVVYFAKMHFDSVESVLSLGEIDIIISKTKNSRPHQIMSLISTDFSKEWHTDEIIDALDDSSLDGEKIYQAALKINGQIAKNSDIKDFLDCSRKKIAVKRKYLDQL